VEEVKDSKDSKVLSDEEKQYERHFQKNTYRNEDGRFVSIPFPQKGY